MNKWASFERIVGDAVEEYLNKRIEHQARKSIDDKIQVIFETGKYINKIIEKLDTTTGALFFSKLENDVRSIIRKHHPPNVIYVHEPKGIPPQLVPFGVKEHILPPTCPCIYFLCRENRIVYIGQTVNLASRLGQHVMSKHFDRIFYFEVAARDLKELEAELIEYYDPELNKTTKGQDKDHHERQRR